MRYKVIVANDGQRIAELVAKALADGWRPQGGIAISLYPDASDMATDDLYIVYAQAMVQEG